MIPVLIALAGLILVNTSGSQTFIVFYKALIINFKIFLNTFFSQSISQTDSEFSAYAKLLLLH